MAGAVHRLAWDLILHVSIRLEGFWAPKDSWSKARELAMMYTWRYHNIMKQVKKELESGTWDNPAEYTQRHFPQLAEDYHADPDFVTMQLFDFPGPDYFMRWIDYASGIDPGTMVNELLLPWTHVGFYSVSDWNLNITEDKAHEVVDKISKDTDNRAYLLAPILQYDDPVNAHGFDLWPPCIREFRDVEVLMSDGVERPLPVYHEFDEKGLDIGGQPV